jgi:hypothetical protein
MTRQGQVTLTMNADTYERLMDYLDREAPARTAWSCVDAGTVLPEYLHSAALGAAQGQLTSAAILVRCHARVS